jgi:hypothetical protein
MDYFVVGKVCLVTIGMRDRYLDSIVTFRVGVGGSVRGGWCGGEECCGLSRYPNQNSPTWEGT